MRLFETKKNEANIFFTSSGWDKNNNYYCFNLVPTIIIEIDNNKWMKWKEFKLEWLCFSIVILIQEKKLMRYKI